MLPASDGLQISTSASHLTAFLFAFTYVASIYVSKHARLSFSSKAAPNGNGNKAPRAKQASERWRDDSDVIRARIVAVSIATALCCMGVFALFWQLVGDGSKDTLLVALRMTITRLGFGLHLTKETLLPHLIAPMLFLGPVYVMFLGSTLPFQKWWSTSGARARFISWQGARNFIVGPVTEEIVFRACALSVYSLAGATRNHMIFLSPLLFGLAHLHHAWETYNLYGKTASAAKRAVIMSLFQFGYTTLFGFYCSYLFLRTGSIFPSISSHIFCNIMGLPDITWELRRFPRRKISIIIFYILGITGFILALGPWTRSDNVFH